MTDINAKRMKKQLVIFDLDGTLLDTSEGIICCYNQTARHYGLPTKERGQFRGIIGGSLKDGFIKLLGMNPEDTSEAVGYYRSLYAEKGMHMFRVYEGIPALLSEIKQCAGTVVVATLKHRDFAKTMLENAGLMPWIDSVYGAFDDPKCDKAYLLSRAMEEFHTDPGAAVLVGDSKFDALGAQKAGIDFVGVTYGWDFASAADVQAGYHAACAETVGQILQTLDFGRA